MRDCNCIARNDIELARFTIVRASFCAVLLLRYSCVLFKKSIGFEQMLLLSWLVFIDCNVRLGRHVV